MPIRQTASENAIRGWERTDNPTYHNRTVETSLHVHPDGTITMQTAASGGGHRFSLPDFTAIELPMVSLQPGGRPATVCGMPRAVQGVADIIGNAPRSSAPVDGIRYVTEGGIHYNPATGEMTYMAPCHNCTGVLNMEANSGIRTLPPPATLPVSRRPDQQIPFTPPTRWGW
jgi:hypothetical protein